MLDFHKLKVFVHVARCGSFSSTQLSLSPSVISRHISDLEANLNIDLFFRLSSGVSLTVDGEKFLKYSEQLLQNIDDIFLKIKNDKKEPSGDLTVQTPTHWSSTLLLRYLPEFTEKYPKINLNIIGDDKQVDFNSERPVVALLAYIPRDDSIIRRYIGEFNLKLFASNEYIATHSEPKSVADLDNHWMIASSGRNILFKELDWHLSLDKNKNEVRKPFLRTTDTLSAISAHCGIGTLAIENPWLKGLPIKNILPAINGPKLKVYYAYGKHLKNYKPVKLLADFISIKASEAVS